MRLALLMAALGAAVQLPAVDQPGQLVDGITCTGDASETYAVYLPAAYTRERPRAWLDARAIEEGAPRRRPMAWRPSSHVRSPP